MGIRRFAGDALAFLADNPLTQSWQGSVDRYVVSPIERALVGEEQLREVLPTKVREMTAEEGGFTPEQLEVIGALAGGKWGTKEREKAGSVMNVLEGMGNRQTNAERIANDAVALGGLDRNALVEIASGLPAGMTGLTSAGEAARGVIGHPLLAYGAVAGGTALAVKGAMDVIGRLQAGEPVSEEEAAAADQVLKTVGGVK